MWLSQKSIVLLFLIQYYMIFETTILFFIKISNKNSYTNNKIK